MSDARVEAAAAAMWAQRPMLRTADGAPRPWAEVPGRTYGARYRGQAEVALAAADAATPILSKDVQVEKIATVLSQADGWLSLAHPSPRHQALLRERALLIYEALIET